MDVFGAIIAGLVGTGVMTALMTMAPRMGMPEMDIIPARPRWRVGR